MLFQRTQPVIAFDIGSSAIKLLQLKASKRGYVVEKFGIKAIDPELIVDGAVMDAGRVVDAVKDLLQEHAVKVKDVVISVSGHSVIVKKISLPPMTEEELEESIKWEAEQYIPFNINDVNLDFHIPPTSDGGDAKDAMSVVLVAVKKDRLAEYTSLVIEAGLNPVVVDVDAFTLENLYGIGYAGSSSEVVALVNIGASVMNIHIVKGGNFSFTRDITSTGGNRYTEMIQRDLNVSYEQAEQLKRGESVEGVASDALAGIMGTMNGEVAAEIGRSFDYFRSTSGHDTIDRVLLSGGTAKIAGLAPFLSERLGVPVEVVDPFRNLQIGKNVDQTLLQSVGPQAAVVVGLATRRPGDR